MFVFVILFAVLLFVLWNYIRHLYGYWKRNGIPSAKSTFPFGSFRGLMETVNIHDYSKKLYDEFKGQGPFAGTFAAIKPLIIAIDLPFIKDVLVKDFTSFDDRGLYYDKENDPLSAHLFSVKGDEWRPLRAKISSTFTSGKMKFMYPTICDVAERFKNVLNDMIDRSETFIETKETLARFTTDVIGTCAFGIECNTLVESDSLFLRMGRKINKEPRHGPLANLLIMSFPKISKFLKIKMFPDDLSEFFLNLVKDTIAYREEGNVERKDFIDILIKMKNSHDLDENNEPKSLSATEIAAQSFVFFLAGFETSSTAMTFALFELAMNKDIQDKARAEIRSVTQKNNGELIYESMKELKYLNQIIMETLRKYPPIGILFREVTRNHFVAEFNYELKKGTTMWIPIYAIHMDPDYYPNPDTFDPDRFTPEAIQNRNSTTYLPFGDGPRNCVGIRFALMEVRIGLSMLLNNFEFSINSKTKLPLEKEPKEFPLSPKGGLFLNIKKAV